MKTKKAIRLFFANHAQFEANKTNLGDWAIFEEMLDSITESIQNLEITVVSSDPSFTGSRYPVRVIKRGVFNTIREIFRTDIVLIGGGEIVQDKSSLVYLPYQLIRPFVAKLLGKRVLAYAIGVGESEEISFLGRIIARFVLNRFDYISVRDNKSKLMLDKLKISKPPVYITADPAYNLQPSSITIANEILKQDSKDKFDIEIPYVVICARSVYHRQHSLLPFSYRKQLGLVSKAYLNKISSFKQKLAQTADYLCENHGYKMVFIPTYSGNEMSARDDFFSQDIMNLMKHKEKAIMLNQNHSPKEIKRILMHCKLLISVPLHPPILASAGFVPCISLSYASKNRAIMKQLKISEFVVRVETLKDEFCVEDIISHIHTIETNREEIKKRIQSAYNNIKTLSVENVSILKNYIMTWFPKQY